MMAFPRWRWIRSLLNRRHREMVEGDLWGPDWLARLRFAAYARQQPTLLELGKQLGIYPARTINGPRGPVIPASPDELAARRELRLALRRKRA